MAVSAEGSNDVFTALALALALALIEFMVYSL